MYKLYYKGSKRNIYLYFNDIYFWNVKESSKRFINFNTKNELQIYIIIIY